MKRHRHIPALINMLHDKDALVRETTALALAGFGPKAAPAVPELIKLLGDQNRRVREGASLALENIGQEAVDPLMQVLKKGQGPDVDLAIQALSRIGKAARAAIVGSVRVQRSENSPSGVYGSNDDGSNPC